jgi:hypothetical protein
LEEVGQSTIHRCASSQGESQSHQAFIIGFTTNYLFLLFTDLGVDSTSRALVAAVLSTAFRADFNVLTSCAFATKGTAEHNHSWNGFATKCPSAVNHLVKGASTSKTSQSKFWIFELSWLRTVNLYNGECFCVLEAIENCSVVSN